MAQFSNRIFARAALGALALAALALSAPASAQRDPAYQAARSAGQVGEKMDGYLGVVGNQPAAIERMVTDINIRRRESYAERAPTANPPATLQEFAFAQGCLQILNTAPGEKYQAPDGSWQTRGAGPPLRDSRCR